MADEKVLTVALTKIAAELAEEFEEGPQGSHYWLGYFPS
jgi:hypothetical protein